MIEAPKEAPHPGQPDSVQDLGSFNAFTPTETSLTAPKDHDYRVVMVVGEGGIGTLIPVRDDPDLKFAPNVTDYGPAQEGAISTGDMIDEATPDGAVAPQLYGRPPVNVFGTLSKPDGYGVPTPKTDRAEVQSTPEPRHFGIFSAISRGLRAVRSSRHAASDETPVLPSAPVVERDAFTPVTVEVTEQSPRSQAPRLLFPDLGTEPASMQAAEDSAAALLAARTEGANSTADRYAAARRGRARANGLVIDENPLGAYRDIDRMPGIGRHRVPATSFFTPETEAMLRAFGETAEARTSTPSPAENTRSTIRARVARRAGIIFRQAVWPTYESVA